MVICYIYFCFFDIYIYIHTISPISCFIFFIYNLCACCLTLLHHNIVMRLLGTCGLVAMASASLAEGRQFDPGQVYLLFFI